MARTHGRILSTIWDDPDFLDLSGAAQRMYFLLISQKKLTLAGSLDFKPARWRLSRDVTRADVEDALDDLEAHRFVVVDRETDELVIRTFVRHDSGYGRNSNLLKGVWSAWASIESPVLRKVVVDNLPDELWEQEKAPAPGAAQQMRWSPPPEPPVPTNGSNDRSDERSNHQSEPQVKTVLTPDPCPLTPASAAAESVVHSTGDGPADAEQRQRFVAACEVLTGRHLVRNPSRHNARRHRASTLKGKLADLEGDGMRLAAEHPDWSPEQLADELEPDSAAPVGSRLALVPRPAADPDCPQCHGAGIYDVGPNLSDECPCKFRSAS